MLNGTAVRGAVIKKQAHVGSEASASTSMRVEGVPANKIHKYDHYSIGEGWRESGAGVGVDRGSCRGSAEDAEEGPAIVFIIMHSMASSPQ